MRRALAAGLAALIVVAGSYGVRSIGDDSVDPPTLTYAVAPTPKLAEVDRLIAVFEERVGTVTDALNSRELGRLYLERGRLTGDVGAYGDAIGALRGALDLVPGQTSAERRLAQASLAVHRFDEALAIASSLTKDDAMNAAALLVVSDASFELGDTAGAIEALDAVESLLGQVPHVMARRAQHADARGDVAGALAFAQEALQAARSFQESPRQIAFNLTLVAHFLNDLGRYDEAESMLTHAFALDPQWPSSHATLGAVLTSQGRLVEAAEAYEAAAALRPDPGTLAVIGDLYAAMGNRAMADDWYRRVELAATETPIHEEAYRRTLATYLADHDLDTNRALELARLDVARRNDPFGQDIFAWVLFRAGRTAEAREAIDGVFAVGLREPAMLYHSALIAIAEGDDDRAIAELREALDRAPRFHPLQAPDAERLLLELGG